MISAGAVLDGSTVCMAASFLWIRSFVRIGHGGGAADGGGTRVDLDVFEKASDSYAAGLCCLL